ncbi:heparan-alpha-glucosaminide N-acetyltransferase domain-containing protein [Bacterioplanoides sp. SCSIO 12839]|uniref:heparan-alpha-glucosaminide N-acetyltransferase domain-containing protein n=1 Tax=Bacterioplanoides sp. SCSIO 12839 TaxID=2829569 RepID=UPI0021066C3D|nr:heparan-alpha-glucosaminide N-acetyltransferase domain-containing protein [Bacterioplanoides sp. SCSIO 12839]UTW48992.1 DUF1624 domain-containing protein [Bacterioplanoides sp. SCSIO 12839]
MSRITWLDTGRGLAIILLIFAHYIGALESRGIISEEVLNWLKAFFRIATPYFILIFGFTFFIAYSRKVDGLSSMPSLYQKLKVRIFKIFIAREMIVLILAFRFPEMMDQLFTIMIYQQFAKGGEILTFYLMAVALAPLAILWMKRVNTSTALVSIFSLYIGSYAIGLSFGAADNSNLFRVLFYNVYPFFPFFALALIGMLIAKDFRSLSNLTVVKVYGSLSAFLIIGSIIGFNLIDDQPLIKLALAKYKAPPHPLYMSLYLGLSIAVTMLVAVLSQFKGWIAKIKSVVDTIGRNSLASYVLHYALYFSVPLAALAPSHNKLVEVFTFILLMILFYLLIVIRDEQKRNGHSIWQFKFLMPIANR